MNIAILVAGLPPERVGGAERQAAQVASRLAARHNVHIFTRTATIPGELASLNRCTVTQRTRVDVKGVRFAADMLSTLALIARHRQRIDVIVAYQSVIDGLIGVLARSWLGIPVVVMVRCDTEYQLDRFFQSRALGPYVFRRADRLGVQSPSIGEDLVRAFEDAGRESLAPALRAKLFVLPNGMSSVPPRHGDGDGIVYVGRLTRNKAVDVLIEAMRALPDERLTIVGDGAERPALEEAARGLSNVTFAGMVDHARVAGYLAGARMLVLPSRQEGQPNIVMEAMALGVPVIATRVGGVPDLVTHGQSGWLVEPGDAGELAAAIRTLSADASLRKRFSENSVREIERYDWPQVMDTFERTLQDVTSRPLYGRSARL